MRRILQKEIVILEVVIVGLSNSLPLLEDTLDVDYGNNLGDTSYGRVHRYKRSTNTSSTDDRSSIEKFFDDPNNKAMYLVFPIFVLIIATCCGLYFCDKCKRYVKKKKAEQRKQENNLMEKRKSENRPNSCKIEDKEDKVNAKEKDVNTTSRGSSVNELQRDDTPLEDVENCPEVKAVNAVPIKHKETSFITDVQNANKNEIKPEQKAEDPKPPPKKVQIDDKKDKQKKSNESISDHSSISKETTSTNDQSRPQSIQSSLKPSRSPSRSSSKQSSDSKIIPDKRRKQEENNRRHNIEPIPDTEIIYKPKRKDSYKSTTSDRNKKRAGSIQSSSTVAFHEKTSLPDVTNTQYPKIDRKFSHLSTEAIGEILQYYKDKKHMPDIIPDEDENAAPIKKRHKKAKYKILNG